MSDDDEFSAEALAKQKAIKAKEIREAQEAAMKDDPELAAIMQETKQVQKDTLSSTQNSVRTIKETIVVADKTSGKLKQQGEQLDRIEEKAVSADANAQESYDSARELHKYKGFIPISMKNIFTGGKKKDEDKKMAQTHKQLDKEGRKLEKQGTAEKDAIVGSVLKGGDGTAAATTAAQKEQPGDDVERQIDENLDEISAGLDHLQMQAASMNQELAKQNVAIKRIDSTTEHTDYTLNSANRKIQEFM